MHQVQGVFTAFLASVSPPSSPSPINSRSLHPSWAAVSTSVAGQKQDIKGIKKHTVLGSGDTHL